MQLDTVFQAVVLSYTQFPVSCLAGADKNLKWAASAAAESRPPSVCLTAGGNKSIEMSKTKKTNYVQKGKPIHHDLFLPF